MAKFQFRLLVLIALGTVAVTSSVVPPWDCGLQNHVNVSSDEIEVKIPDSDVVFYRVTVTDFQLQFAMKSSVSLPSDSVLECAIAAASEGLVAFAFDGNCTGYLLNLYFSICQTGDLAVFVLPTYLDVEPSVVPMDEAPYKIVKDGARKYRAYMLSAYFEAKNHPSFKKANGFKYVMRSDNKNNFVFLENGDVIYSNYLLLDVNSCLNNAAFGLQVVVSPHLYRATFPIVYFYEECGNKIQIPNSRSAIKMLMFSHRGFGCKPYPSGLPDRCSVVFESEGSRLLSAEFGFFFSNDNSDAGGLIMKFYARNDKGSMSTNMYRPRATRIFGDRSWFHVSMQRQPSKPVVGFFTAFS